MENLTVPIIQNVTPSGKDAPLWHRRMKLECKRDQLAAQQGTVRVFREHGWHSDADSWEKVAKETEAEIAAETAAIAALEEGGAQ